MPWDKKRQFMVLVLVACVIVLGLWVSLVVGRGGWVWERQVGEKEVGLWTTTRDSIQQIWYKGSDAVSKTFNAITEEKQQ